MHSSVPMNFASAACTLRSFRVSGSPCPAAQVRNVHSYVRLQLRPHDSLSHPESCADHAPNAANEMAGRMHMRPSCLLTVTPAA